MSDQPRRARRHPYRELIHELNQRYYREWRRAERLERELALIRGRLLGPLLGWLRWLKRRLLPGGEVSAQALACSGPAVQEDAGADCGRVSVIIPFKDRPELLRTCLRSLRRTCPAGTELVLVDNGSRQRRTRRYLRRLEARGAATVVRWPGPFNFSRLCNEGARRAGGDYLLFLNNDTEALAPGWLERLVRLGCRPEVGVVGATLVYPDDTIQHAGLFPDAAGRWVHAGRGLPPGALSAVRVVPAVTGACLLIRRGLFVELGGFDERLPVTYGDVDLCRRAAARGLLVVVTPHARLIHYEGLSRGFAGDEPGNGHLTALARFPGPGEPPG
jgi:O-antigen biosynthesis protein